MIEPVLSVKTAAEGLGLSYDSARRIFSLESGVLKIGQPTRRVGHGYKRRYYSLRIPLSVFERVKDRYAAK